MGFINLPVLVLVSYTFTVSPGIIRTITKKELSNLYINYDTQLSRPNIKTLNRVSR